MTLRFAKIILAIFVGLLGIFYAIENIFNLDAAYNAVAYALSMDGHNIYPNSLAPVIAVPTLIWAVVVIIILGEALGGIIALKGAYELYQARHGDQFNNAKKTLYLGAAVLLIVWFGFFTVIGGALFQMWQTEAGAMSLEGAFQFLGSVALITLFISLPD